MAEDDRDRTRERERVDEEMDAHEFSQSDAEGLEGDEEDDEDEEGDRADGSHVEASSTVVWMVGAAVAGAFVARDSHQAALAG